MRTYIHTFLCLLAFISFTTCSQVKQTQQQNPTDQLPWKNKQAAIVLTYDDGLNVHITNAIPALNAQGLRGTFYIADLGNLREQIPGWKAAAAKGHELANHTLYHPCVGGSAGREFVKPERDLRYYSVSRITDEIKAMNTILKAIDGKTKRTFAFPCGDSRIRDTPYINGVKNELIAARSVHAEMPTLDKVELFNVPSYMINGETGDQLIELVKRAMEKKALLVFLFHGVGGEHGLNVSLEAHSKLLQFLKQHREELWIAPMSDVAEYVSQHQKKSM